MKNNEQPQNRIQSNCGEFKAGTTMDLIWKALVENDPSFDRLRLFCKKDPASGALSVIQCNHITGITYEENFSYDFLYLVEAVLPENHSLKVVEIEWSYLEQLEEEEQRGELLYALGAIKSIEDVEIRGTSNDCSKIFLNRLQRLVEQTTQLKHLLVDVTEIVAAEQSEMDQFARVLMECHQLESLHLSPLTCSTDDEVGLFDSLLRALSRLECLKTVHLSHTESSENESDDEDEEENEQEEEMASLLVSHSALNEICHLAGLASLALINMDLQDSHCQVLEESVAESNSLQRLVLLDNDKITDEGNESLLRLLQKNRSIFASLYGIDTDSPHRFEQLKLLHMNRCGRGKMRGVHGASTKEWVEYVTMINETVPEEFDLDTLFAAVAENPEVVRLHGERTYHVQEIDSEGIVASEASIQQHQFSDESKSLELTEEILKAKEMELMAFQSKLAEKERQLRGMEQHLSDLGLYVGKVGSLSPTSSLQFPYEPGDEEKVHA